MVISLLTITVIYRLHLLSSIWKHSVIFIIAESWAIWSFHNFFEYSRCDKGDGLAHAIACHMRITKIFTLCSSLFWIYSLLREPLGIILLQKIGYFMSYQSLPFQFTLVAGDQSKQRNYFSGRARFSSTSVTWEQILVRILQFITLTTCGAFGL